MEENSEKQIMDEWKLFNWLQHVERSLESWLGNEMKLIIWLRLVKIQMLYKKQMFNLCWMLNVQSILHDAASAFDRPGLFCNKEHALESCETVKGGIP